MVINVSYYKCKQWDMDGTRVLQRQQWQHDLGECVVRSYTKIMSAYDSIYIKIYIYMYMYTNIPTEQQKIWKMRRSRAAAFELSKRNYWNKYWNWS